MRKYGEKKFKISGSKYLLPNFNALFEILAELIPRAFSLNNSPPSKLSDQVF